MKHLFISLSLRLDYLRQRVDKRLIISDEDFSIYNRIISLRLLEGLNYLRALAYPYTRMIKSSYNRFVQLFRAWSFSVLSSSRKPRNCVVKSGSFPSTLLVGSSSRQTLPVSVALWPINLKEFTEPRIGRLLRGETTNQRFTKLFMPLSSTPSLA